MTVEIAGQTYVVHFENRSERRVHDETPQEILDMLAEFEERQAQRAEGGEDHLRWKRFLTLKHPKAISLITSACSISDATTHVVQSSGQSFYSKSEIDAGVKFNKRGAKARSLRRALGQDIDHRAGRVWTQDERDLFWIAFDELHKRRDKRVVSPTPEVH